MDTKICDTCTLPRPVTAFRPSGHGTIHRNRTCRKCVRQRWKTTGRCYKCGRPAKLGSNHCQRHLDAMTAKEVARREKDRQLVFDHYGWQCSFCGQSNPMFLTIDHINNDGAEHRKNNTKPSGGHLYRWLRLHHLPAGFQTLCWNCNCAKSIFGLEALLASLNPAR